MDVPDACLPRLLPKCLLEGQTGMHGLSSMGRQRHAVLRVACIIRYLWFISQLGLFVISGMRLAVE